MKKITLAFFLVFLSCSALLAQANSEWQQMKDFHGYISSTFHPAEEGNLAPLKSKAGKLLESAILWQKSPVPADYKPDETKSALLELVKQTTLIRDAVKAKAPDSELKNLLSGAHDIFHRIVGECKISDK